MLIRLPWTFPMRNKTMVVNKKKKQTNPKYFQFQFKINMIHQLY